jgi:hypothetical protein
MQSPTDDHFTAIKRILPYLKVSVTLGIQFTRGPFTLKIGQVILVIVGRLVAIVN